MSAIYFANPHSQKLGKNESLIDGSRKNSMSLSIKLYRKLLSLRTHGETLVVHGHLTRPLYICALLSFFLKCDYYFTEHSTYNRRRKYRAMAALERCVYRRYARIICISFAVQRSLSEWLNLKEINEKMVVIYNGVRMFPLSARESREQRGLRLLTVGSHSHWKGIDIGLKAAALISEDIESYTLIGEGPETGELQRLADELNIREKVKFIGFTDDIGPILADCDIAIVPSRREGFGLFAVEALSSGIPVVASEVPGLSEVIELCSTSFFANPDCPSSFADQIRLAAFISDTDTEGLVSNVRAVAELFRAEVMLEKYQEEYVSYSLGQS